MFTFPNPVNEKAARVVAGAVTVLATLAVVTGWRSIARELKEAGNRGLADAVTRFVEQMPPPTTDQVQVVRQFGARGRSHRVDPMERTL